MAEYLSLLEIESEDAKLGKASSSNGPMEDTLQCLSRGSQLTRLILTSSEIIIKILKESTVIEKYSISDIYGCHTLRHKHNPTEAAYLAFFLFPLIKKKIISYESEHRERMILVFEVKKEGFCFNQNFRLATDWKKRLTESLSSYNGKFNTLYWTQEHGGKNIDVELSNYFSLERKILAIVNPKSGQGKSVSLFEDRVVAILKEAGMKYQLLVTKRRKHAFEAVLNFNLDEIDGIVTVGGDGLLYEVVNGIRQRKDAYRYAKMPVGVIASGSGNGLARSIAHYSEESKQYLKDPVLSTIMGIAKGRFRPINLVEVDLDGEKSYSFLSTGWGLMADIDVESEVIRIIGELRFSLWSIFRLAKLRSNYAELSYVEHDSNLSVVVQDDFINVYASYQAYIGTDLVFAPNAKPNDGIIQLEFLTMNAGGRKRAAQYLYAMEKGKHGKVSGVMSQGVKEFTLSCPGGIPGNLMLDGERVSGQTIHVKICDIPLNVYLL